MKQLYVFFVFALISATSLAANEWKNSAIKLSADPEIRQQGVKELKAVKNLSEQLSMAFKSDRALVLQVVRTLELRDFLPRLFEIISTSSAKDLSYDVIETATFLASDASKKELIQTYTKKLDTPKISDTATLALLLGLQKFNYQIEEKKLLSYLDHPSYEVRIAAVDMAQQLNKDKKTYDKVFQKAIVTSPYQVRMIAYSEFLSNADLKKSYQSDLTKACDQEKNDEAKELCQKLKGEK